MASLAYGLLLSLVFVNVGVHTAAGDCSNATWFSTQLDLLLAEYDREVAPGAPISVRVGLDVRHATIDQDQATIYILADLRLSWVDSRLRWNESEWGCGSAPVSAERLWLPEVSLLNGAMSAGVGDGDSRVRIASNGSVLWVSRLDATAPVTLHLDHWPSDLQAASFKFGSRVYSADEVNLLLLEGSSTIWAESGGWCVASVESGTWRWDRGGDVRSVVGWTVSLRRRARAHCLAADAVLAAALLLLGAAAMLPPASRTPLCACAALTTSFWLISTVARLPNAASSPVCVRVMSVLCACCGAACTGAALAARVARVTSPPPHTLRTLVATLAAKINLTSAQEMDGASSSVWSAAARLLDLALRLLLACAALVLLLVYCIN